jgi:hypothetical protein
VSPVSQAAKARPMVERRVDPIAIVARIKRGPVDKDDAVEAEIALDTLDFLDAECRETGCDPGPTAHLVVLDLAAALIAFGAVRSVDELAAWLRKEAPGRALELVKAVANCKDALADAPICSCLSMPEPATWH